MFYGIRYKMHSVSVDFVYAQDWTLAAQIVLGLFNMTKEIFSI